MTFYFSLQYRDTVQERLEQTQKVRLVPRFEIGLKKNFFLKTDENRN